MKNDIRLRNAIIINIVTIIIAVLITIIIVNNKDVYNSVNLEKVELTQEEQKEAQSKIENLLTELKHSNSCFQVFTDSDKYNTYIYNTKGEVYYENADSSERKVFLENNKSIVFNKYLYVIEDVDILTLLLNSVKLIGEKDIEFYGLVEDDKEVCNRYVIYLNGWDTIKNLYEQADDSVAEAYINNLKSYLDNNYNPIMTIEIYTGENKSLDITCSFIDDDTKYINWYINGYLGINSWVLDAEWYTSELKDVKEADELLSKLVDDIQKVIVKNTQDK